MGLRAGDLRHPGAEEVNADGLTASELIAIDVHTHAEVSRDGRSSLSPELLGASADYFKAHGHRQPAIDETAAYYRERRMAAVVFTVDAEHATGHPRIANEEIAEDCAKHPETLIPFASIDPHKGRAGVREARRLVEAYGVRGFKFHPSIQGFAPDDRLAYPMYEAIEELGAVALFHTGQTGIGARVRGGGGIRLKYSNPMLVDDVAVDFPDLRIILAHPSFPWQDEALAVATHKEHVHIDLSGWSPKYFPPQLIRYANSLLQDKVLFGSDYPVLTPDRWLADFAALEIKDTVRPKILKENAARLLLRENP
ncbi:amidohydrolase family protein [Actinoplanes italicus]|uniref:amidohydrolase family protein n=1 Tax=Actinoplanes italicus TaxID=113567 RepID=UPI003D15F5F0